MVILKIFFLRVTDKCALNWQSKNYHLRLQVNLIIIRRSEMQKKSKVQYAASAKVFKPNVLNKIKYQYRILWTFFLYFSSLNHGNIKTMISSSSLSKILSLTPLSQYCIRAQCYIYTIEHIITAYTVERARHKRKRGPQSKCHWYPPTPFLVHCIR